jgi:hypothetical protein
MRLFCLLWALLPAAPVFSQAPSFADPQIRQGRFEWLRLEETRAEVASLLGPPAVVASYGAGFESWQFQLDSREEHDVSHVAVFRVSTGRLISITRFYDPEQNLDRFFPAAGTETYWFSETGRPDYPLLLRRLPGDLLLLAMGVSERGQPAGQLVLLRASELSAFYPWLARELAGGRSSHRRSTPHR